MLILPWEPRWPLSGAMSSSLMTEDQCPETWLWFVSVLCLPQSGWCCSLDTLHPRETKTGCGNTSTHRGFSRLIKYISALTGQVSDWILTRCGEKRKLICQSIWIWFEPLPSGDTIYFLRSKTGENMCMIAVFLHHRCSVFIQKRPSWKTIFKFQSESDWNKIKYHNSCLTGNVSFWRKIENDSQCHHQPLWFQARIQTGDHPVHFFSNVDILLPSHNKLFLKTGEMFLSVSLTVASQISLGK